jgi:tetratricopeptide (TPR) repeat protein
LWVKAVFELYNIANADDFDRLNREAAEGRIVKEDYIVRLADCEARAAEKARAFYIHVYLPWAMAENVPTDARLWLIASRANCKENLVVPHLDRRSPYWANYARSYDARRIAYVVDKSDDNETKALLMKMVSQAATNEEKAVVFANFGGAFGGKGQFDKALACFSGAIDLDPKNAVSRSSRGYCYTHLRDFDKAIADYNEAIRLDPKTARAWAGRAATHEFKSEHEDAIADYTAGLRIDPKNAAMLFGRGTGYGNLGNFEKAIADFTAALQLDPKNETGFLYRGTAYAQTAELDKAIADFDEAIRLNAKSITAYLSRAAAHEKKGDKAKADADRAMVEKLQKDAMVEHGAKGPERHGK